MSAENNNLFARWSRRKLEAREAEAPIPEEPKPEAKAAAEENADRGDLQSAPAEPDAAEPAEPLPRLEDLTPESDVTAFLRKGIPGTLRNTALRRMWSLDPVIRDYVGPAEYAWDFNKPGSMPGFGPLEAGKAVANFLSKVGSSDPQDTAVEPVSAPPEEKIASSDEAAASPDQPAEASAPSEPALPEKQPETPQFDPSQSRLAEAEPAPANKTTPARSLSRHGGALPR